MSMILHKGGQHADLDAVYAVKTPAATLTHHPIAHQTLIELTLTALETQGYHVVGTEHALNHGGMQYFGLYQLQGRDYPDNPLKSLVAALRNSHDQSFVAGFAGGERVFVCDNLALSAEVVFHRKHTSRIEIDLPGLVGDAVQCLRDVRQTAAQREDRYRQAGLTVRDADHLLMEAFRGGALPPSWIGKVWKEYHHPRHPEFRADRGTTLGLYQALTEFFKEGSAFALPQRSRVVHRVLDGYCRTVLPANEPFHEPLAEAA